MRLLNLLLIFFLIPGSTFASNKPFTKEEEEQFAWKILMAHIVTYQPKNVGWDSYAKTLGIKSYMNHGIELYRLAAKVKSWPTISVSGETLKIESDGEKTITVSFDASKSMLLINEKALTLDLKMPITPQVIKALSNESTLSFSLFGTTAHAADDRLKGLGTTMVGSVSILGGLVTALASSTASGAAVGVGLVAIGLGSVVCAIVEGGRYWGVSEAYGERLINCLSSPLSLFGINPRDRLDLKEIECLENEINVSVRSRSGRKQKRKFYFSKNDGLSKITLASNSAENVTFNVSSNGSKIESGQTTLDDNIQASGKLKRPKNAKLLDEAQVLIKDFEVYKVACSDPELLRKIRYAISTKTAPKVYSGESLQKIHEKAE